MSPSGAASRTVLHVVSGDLYAGAERIVEELAIAQHSRLRLRVIAVVLNHGRLAHELQREGVETHVLDERRLNAPGLILQLRKLIRITQPQVVHTHRFKENVLGSLAALGLAPGIRTVHGAPEFSRSGSLRARAIEKLDRFTASRLQRRVVCVSEELLERMRAFYPDRSLATVVNGIDGSRVRAAGSQPVAAVSGAIRVGVFARLAAVKRIELAIDAVTRARHELGADIVLHVFGSGGLEASLQSHAAGRRGIEFHGNTDQAPSYMRQMDATLLTSSHEGLPVSILESMALSVPVVATRTGGIPAVLADGGCGWLVDAADTEGYSRSLIEAVSPSPVRSNKIAAALQRVEREFSATRMAEDYSRLYAEIAPGALFEAGAAAS
jgi:glycosyltransferase involved in cell wall biosynthesis